jgi:hypothetical protein
MLDMELPKMTKKKTTTTWCHRNPEKKVFEEGHCGKHCRISNGNEI